MPPAVMLKAKQLGFSDKQIAQAVQRWESRSTGFKPLLSRDARR